MVDDRRRLERYVGFGDVLDRAYAGIDERMPWEACSGEFTAVTGRDRVVVEGESPRLESCPAGMFWGPETFEDGRLLLSRPPSRGRFRETRKSSTWEMEGNTSRLALEDRSASPHSLRHTGRKGKAYA